MSCIKRLNSLHSAIVAAMAVLLLLSCSAVTPHVALAEDTDSASANNRYYYDTKVNTGRDNGYSGSEEIGVDDPHFGWNLGSFVVSGFTSRADDNGTPVFLKNVGDEVKLSFILDQDIDALNGDSKKKISNDKNGYDQEFEIAKKNDGFGRGTLIVQHTDFQNASTDPQVFRDYLPAREVGAETDIDLCEEGDYVVALDYEVETAGNIPVVSNIPITHRFDDYRIAFRFKVRNSNTMMFLIDTGTGSELYNGFVTQNGFRIDLAGSHYLDVSVKRELMNEGHDGLVEDTKFNRTATDGATYTQEGIYTITVKNPSTGEEPTTKRIYVGDDDVLKAAVANHMDVADVEERIEDGATVGADGKFVQASAADSTEDVSASEDSSQIANASSGGSLSIAVPALIAIAVAAVVIVLWAKKRKRDKAQNPSQSKGSDAK